MSYKYINKLLLFILKKIAITFTSKTLLYKMVTTSSRGTFQSIIVQINHLKSAITHFFNLIFKIHTIY